MTINKDTIKRNELSVDSFAPRVIIYIFRQLTTTTQLPSEDVLQKMAQEDEG